MGEQLPSHSGSLSKHPSAPSSAPKSRPAPRAPCHTLAVRPFLLNLYEALNTRLFELPRRSAAHEIERRGPFRSLTLRFLWSLWFRLLTPGGRYFFLATGLFFGYGVTSLEFQAFVPLAYALILWSAAFLMLTPARPVLQLETHNVHRIAAGQELPIAVTLRNPAQTSSGDARVLAHLLPANIDMVPNAGLAVPALRPGARTDLTLALRPRSRGIYDLRGWRVESDFPFGLLNAGRVHEAPARLLVYPRFEPLDRIALPQGRRQQPGGVAYVANRGESIEYIGNREYREGDNVRDIDWRATARLSRPIVREYREEFFLRAALVLDTQVPRTRGEWVADKAEDFERAVSLCAACGDYLNRADYLIDILAAGPKVHHLIAGRGLLSTDQMLDILAGVEANPQSFWQELEAPLGAELERIASVVCLFLDWDEARRAFAANLRDAGAALKIVIVRDEAPSLDPTESWPGEVLVLGAREFEMGVREL